MKKIGIQLCITVLLLIIYSGCDQFRVFEAYNKIPRSGWHKDSLAVFEIPISDSLQNHNLFINVRNDIEYRYSNLWLFIEIEPPQENSTIDTIELVLANPNGKWLGEGFGGIKTRQVLYKGGVYFPTSGDYKINIRHGMREELLKGLTDIGFRVEKTD